MMGSILPISPFTHQPCTQFSFSALGENSNTKLAMQGLRTYAYAY
jgi:hypothetical protein